MIFLYIYLAYLQSTTTTTTTTTSPTTTTSMKNTTTSIQTTTTTTSTTLTSSLAEIISSSSQQTTPAFISTTLITSASTSLASSQTSAMSNLNETKLNFSTSLLADLLPYFSQYDLSACLINCSSKGVCANSINNQNQIYCLCQNGYEGVSCNKQKDPCQYMSCLNNAKCQMNNSMTYCNCSSEYYGEYCENKVDLCLNETCSYKGVCVDNNGNGTYCKCFLGYSGARCEIESANLKTINTIKFSTVIVAVIVLVLFSGFILFLDLSHLCMGGKSVNKVKPMNERAIKFVYKP